MNDKDTEAWLGEPQDTVSEAGAGSAAASHAQPLAVHQEPIAFEFRGNAGEYFKVWVVNLALSMLTLGIYSPWAKVRKLRYFYGNTYLDGSSFEFLGKPIAILKGRIIAALAFAAYWLAANFYPAANIVLLPLFAVCFPWVMVKALNFRSRSSAYRNLTFSYYGSYWQIAVAYLGLPLLMLGSAVAMFYVAGVSPPFTNNLEAQLSPQVAAKVGMLFGVVILFGSLLVPFFYYLQKRAFLAPRKFGDSVFSFDCRPRDFYRLLMKVSLIGLLMLIIVGVTMGVTGTFAKGTPHSGSHSTGTVPIIITIIMILVQYLLFITYITWMRNMVLSAVRIGEAQLSSRLRVIDVFMLYLTNLIAIVCSLGLLIPWAKVRLTRYQMKMTGLLAPRGTELFTGTPGRSASAIGEELADFFDMDLAL